MPTGCYKRTKKQLKESLERIRKWQALTGNKNPFWGHHHTEEAKARMRAVKIGKRMSPATEFKKGQKPLNWKGGRYGYIQKECLTRDNYTCQICNLRDEEIMQVDHIKPKFTHPELYWKIENLRALCPNCHERKSRREKGIASKSSAERRKLEKWIGVPAKKIGKSIR